MKQSVLRTMAPTKSGGRPKIAWTASRKRKLLRLYLLTDITMDEIQQVLGADGFAPRKRNIQTQLGALLSDNAKSWRDYRPSGQNQMKYRLAQLKGCRANQVSKYTRLRAQDSKVTHVTITDKSLKFPITSESLIQEEHEEALPAGVPCHSSLPHLGSWYSQYQALFNQGPATTIEDLDNRRWSDKEVISPIPDMPTSKSTFNPRNEQGDAVPAIDLISATEQFDESCPALVLERGSSSSFSTRVKRSNSKLSTTCSSSIRNLSVRLSTRLSRSASHVNSVLSMTNSWRSSLVYAGSISSDRMSKTTEATLNHHELLSWNELVDESKLAPATSRQHLDYEAASLRKRPCCEFFENDNYKRTLCNVCGFSEMHHIARFSLSDDGDWIDSTLLDRFGNIPLHHAAAAGNTTRVLQLMCSAAQILARNTSGETFLHVFHLDSLERLPEYIEVLRKASSMCFPFFTRDYSGRTVDSIINEFMDINDLDLQLRREVTQILTSDGATIDASGMGPAGKHIPDGLGPSGSEMKSKEQKKPAFGLNQLKDALFHPKLRRAKPVEANNKFEANGDTKLISTLKRWPENPISRVKLEYLIQRSDIHMRDERGYTALAIAAQHGLRDIVSLLLKHGANPNTRSYRNTSVLAHAASHLARAQKENDDQLYARILSCIVLLTDHHAKAIVTIFDEYTWRPPPSFVETKDFHMALSTREMHTPLDICGANKHTLSELAVPEHGFWDLDAPRSIYRSSCLSELPASLTFLPNRPLELPASPHLMKLPESDLLQRSLQISPTSLSFLDTVNEEDAESNNFSPTWAKAGDLDHQPPGNFQALPANIAALFDPSANDFSSQYSEEPESAFCSVHSARSLFQRNQSASPKKLSPISPLSQISFQTPSGSLKYHSGNGNAAAPVIRCEKRQRSYSHSDNFAIHKRREHYKSYQTGSSTLSPAGDIPQTVELPSLSGTATSRQKRKLSDEMASTRPSQSHKYIKISAKEKRELGDMSCNNSQILSQGNKDSRNWDLDLGGFHSSARMPVGSTGIDIEMAPEMGGSALLGENTLSQVWPSNPVGFLGHHMNEPFPNGFQNWNVGEFGDPAFNISVEQELHDSSGITPSKQNIQYTAIQHSGYVLNDGISGSIPDNPGSLGSGSSRSSQIELSPQSAPAGP